MSDSAAPLAARSRLPKHSVRAAASPSLAGLTTLVVFVVVVGALYWAREVLIPITVAVLLSFVLTPLVSWLRRWGLGRTPSVFAAVLLALGIMLGLAVVIGGQVAQLSSNATAYAQAINAKVATVRAFAAQRLSVVERQISGPAAPSPSRGPASAPVAGSGGPTAPVAVEVHQPEQTPFELLERLAMPILAPLGTLAIVIVVAIFILLQMEDLRDRLIRLFGSGDLHRTTSAMDEAASRLSKYFLAQVMLNAGMGLAVALALWGIGIPSPALFGIIAALFRFVPYVGTIGSAGLPILVAAAIDPGWNLVFLTIAAFAVIEGIVSQVLEPLAYGHSTGLSPISVVVSAIFWGWLWGPVGLILAMPLTSCVVVLGRHVETLQFLDVLLGDQPALTPAEGFYQRMLAGDADEALDQAEALLKERSLSAYYDEVVLRGLAMAAGDRLRGVLTDEQLRHIQEAVSTLVHELAEHADTGPRAEGVAGTVLCVAGRGVLDEAACSLLAQILVKRGVNARVMVGDQALPRAVEGVDMSGVDVVCVSYLEAGGRLAGLRWLLRRMRRHAGSVPVLVGLFHSDPASVEGQRARSAAGSDPVVASLTDAVAACIARLPAVRVAAAPADAPDPLAGVAIVPSAV